VQPRSADSCRPWVEDADRFSDAVDSFLGGARPWEEVMAAAHAARDAHAAPIYEFTTQLATREPPPPELQQLFAAMAGNQAAMDAFVSVVAGTVSPIEFFDRVHIDRLLHAAA
jgi:hypothetical protein